MGTGALGHSITFHNPQREGFIMRGAVTLVVAVAASLAALSAVPSPAPVLSAVPKCANPNALGVTRTVEIDTTGGPGFGGEHFKQHDFLRNKEVVLTFDDGPWPTTTQVLKALADECVRVTF